MFIEILGDAINTDLITEIKKVESNRDSHIRHTFDIVFANGITKQIVHRANCFVTEKVNLEFDMSRTAYKQENIFLSWQHMTMSDEYKKTLKEIETLRERIIKILTKNTYRYKLEYDENKT